MSSRSLRVPSAFSTASASNPVGGVYASARRASASSTRSRAAPSAIGSGSRGVPQRARRSTSTVSASSSSPFVVVHSAGVRAITAEGSPQRASAPLTESRQLAGAGSLHTTALRASDAGVSSRRAWRPTATQTSPSEGRSLAAATSSSARVVSASTSAERTRATSSARRFEAAGRRRISGSRRATVASDSTLSARAIERRAPSAEPRSRPHPEQVAILDDADQLALFADDRSVADTPLEHLEQHLAAQPVGRHREHRRRHHGRDRRADRQAGGRATATGIR